ncbi:MAG: hypothetical protein V2A34_15450 [Lentisphaerota bacterium]
MTRGIQHLWKAALLSLLVALLSSGCASLRAPPVPADPPAGHAGAVQAVNAGFSAVYEGELGIWFHSIKTIWYAAMPPGGGSLSVAVLSPMGLKIMQMHGTPAKHSCTIALPAAARLQPYGESLWTGLLWSLAEDLQGGEWTWTRQGDQVLGTVTNGAMRAQCRAEAGSGRLAGKQIFENGRRAYDIRLSGAWSGAERSCPEQIEIRCTRPRCSLNIKLKSLRWGQGEGEHRDATGP